jgi:hypothetical protein
MAVAELMAGNSTNNVLGIAGHVASPMLSFFGIRHTDDVIIRVITKSCSVVMMH